MDTKNIKFGLTIVILLLVFREIDSKSLKIRVKSPGSQPIKVTETKTIKLCGTIKTFKYAIYRCKGTCTLSSGSYGCWERKDGKVHRLKFKGCKEQHDIVEDITCTCTTCQKV